ncbi:MAG: nitrile hydratase accessory protein [Hyphomicrobiales bacterium]
MTQSDDALATIASIPRDPDGPVFRAPWEAQAFAMAVKLHERGVFTWPEWAEALGAEIATAGAHDTGEDYYLHWMNALQKLATAKGVVGADEFRDRKDAWDRAARATPHGEPIELGRESRADALPSE